MRRKPAVLFLNKSLERRVMCTYSSSPAFLPRLLAGAAFSFACNSVRIIGGECESQGPTTARVPVWL